MKKLLELRPRAPGKQSVQQKLSENNVNILLNKQNKITMAMFNYGVGGNEVKVDANEAIQEIQENKTMLVSKLTQDDPVSPEIITGLRTVEDVFRYFQPSVDVEHETADGQTRKEVFKFNNLADFTPKGITQQSRYLGEMNLQKEQYNNIIRQIKTNKVLRSILENAESKTAFIDALKAVAKELETGK